MKILYKLQVFTNDNCLAVQPMATELLYVSPPKKSYVLIASSGYFFSFSDMITSLLESTEISYNTMRDL